MAGMRMQKLAETQALQYNFTKKDFPIEGLRASRPFFELL